MENQLVTFDTINEGDQIYTKDKHIDVVFTKDILHNQIAIGFERKDSSMDIETFTKERFNKMGYRLYKGAVWVS